MAKSERFGMLLSPSEKAALRDLSEIERISAAGVVRRLIWREARRRRLPITEPTESVDTAIKGVNRELN